MKKEKIFIFRVISIILLILLSNVFLIARERTYSPEEGLPNIKEYPPGIQLLDSMKTDLFRQEKLHKNNASNFEFSDEYLKEFARVYFNYFMKYSSIYENGPRSQYIKESYPIGLKMMRALDSLPYPWDFMYFKKGLVLAEIVDDNILPRKKTHISEYIDKDWNNHVITAKIIDDIFDSCDEDTILVRHNNSIFIDYNEYKDMNILFTFKPKSTIQRADSVQYIYLLGAPNEFMFVKDSIIYDPNSILKITGKPYRDFKRELQDFIELGGIAK